MRHAAKEMGDALIMARGEANGAGAGPRARGRGERAETGSELQGAKR